MASCTNGIGAWCGTGLRRRKMGREAEMRRRKMGRKRKRRTEAESRRPRKFVGSEEKECGEIGVFILPMFDLLPSPADSPCPPRHPHFPHPLLWRRSNWRNAEVRS